jgi:hypothetical protein
MEAIVGNVTHLDGSGESDFLVTLGMQLFDVAVCCVPIEAPQDIVDSPRLRRLGRQASRNTGERIPRIGGSTLWIEDSLKIVLAGADVVGTGCELQLMQAYRSRNFFLASTKRRQPANNQERT